MDFDIERFTTERLEPAMKVFAKNFESANMQMMLECDEELARCMNRIYDDMGPLVFAGVAPWMVETFGDYPRIGPYIPKWKR